MLDKKLIETIRQDPAQILHLSEEIQNNREIMLEIISQVPSGFNFLTDHFIDDDDFIYQGVLNDVQIYNLTSIEKQNHMTEKFGKITVSNVVSVFEKITREKRAIEMKEKFENTLDSKNNSVKRIKI